MAPASTHATVGYMVGRFNPLQKGHLTLLNHVRDSNDYMVILVGSAAERRTHKNPLSFEERKALLQGLFPSAVIMPLPDMPDDDDWVANLKSTVAMAIGSLRLEKPVHARIYSADATRGDDFALRMSWATRLGHEVIPFVPVRTSTDLSASLVRDAWYHGRYDDIADAVPPETMELMRKLDIGWMKSHYIKKLETGALGQRNAVFAAFVSDPAQLYVDDERSDDWGPGVRQSRLATLGYVTRWNGELGFVGGRVQSGDSLALALGRHCRAQLGIEFGADRFELLATHKMLGKGDEQHTHLFLCRVSIDEMLELRRQALLAQRASSDIAGFCVTHLTAESPDILQAQRWAGTGLECLKALLWSGKVPVGPVAG